MLQTLNAKLLPHVLERALQGHDLDDFYFVPVTILLDFWGLDCMGDPQLCTAAVRDAVQRQARFTAGELRLITLDSFPAVAVGSAAKWRVYDMAEGLVAEGQNDYRSPAVRRLFLWT